MNGELSKAVVYTDFQGLAELRSQAQQDSRQALQSVAQQFEALFMQMMLKSMREASLGEGLLDSEQSGLYRDMYDKQLALSLSQSGGGLGLAERLVAQLQASLPAAEPAAEAEGADAAFVVPPRQSSAVAPVSAAETPAAAAVPSAAVVAKTPSVTPLEPAFDSPEQFIQSLWPHARRAAEQLGVAPEALLAQAALETGWGKAVIRHPDGSSSHNLFNIKADQRWDGARVGKQTLEYSDGAARLEQAQFRAYPSYAESFDDYVQFLQHSPRYREALEQGQDAGAYIDALHRGGYATDPAYSQKVRRVMESEPMRQSLAGLKISEERTLS